VSVRGSGQFAVVGVLPVALLCWLVLGMLLPLGAAHATVAPRLVATDRLVLGPGLLYVEDTSGGTTFHGPEPGHHESILAADTPWKPLGAASVNLGFSRSSFWFTTTIAAGPDSPSELMLEQRYALMDEMDVHWHCDSGMQAHFSAGDSLPWSARPFPHPGFVFPLILPPGDTCRLLIRARNTEAMELPLVLWKKSSFHDEDRQRTLVDGVFFGVLLVMALYNFVLWLSVREDSYLYYAGFVLMLNLFFASQLGYLYQWTLGYFPYWHYLSVPLIIIGADVFGSLFYLRFLRLRERMPRLAWIIYVTLVATVMSGLLSLMLDYQTLIALVLAITGFNSLAGIVAAVYLSGQGSRPAQFLVMGWLAFIVCVIIMVLTKFGAMHSDFISEYGMRLGAAIEVVIFSFALSLRINEERRAKEQALLAAEQAQTQKVEAQALALASEREARSARELALEQQRKLNEQLEMMVHERTHELEDALQELERTNRELQTLSVKDALTNVFNRRFFNQKIVDEWQKVSENTRSLVLLMIDIDHFKRINDTHGHLCGDQVLVRVAALLRQWVSRPGDTICRYGGEEFAVLLSDTDGKGGERVARSLVERIREEAFSFQGAALQITVSIGVASAGGGFVDEDPVLFVERADKALYEAKQAGRDRVVANRQG
jgi:diguanylate cyclase (GGDEF)-like protein